MARVDFLFILKDKVSAGLGKINKNVENLEKNLKGASIRLEHLSKKTEYIGRLGKKITNVGKGLTVGVTLPVLAMGGAMVKASADMEAMQQQLSTMLGSEDAGAKMFKEITNMASKTPFGTKELMQATNTMLGFGISQKKVLPLMNQLGDISGGNAERFQSLALAFSQVSSAGKLQGQDLMQMINAGFNPLESIAKRTGKSVGYWKEQMSKGKVTVEMVEQAMKDATSEGGRFFKMMEKQSKTALGQWSTFQDELNMLLADFGKIILPYAIKGLQKLSKILQWLNSLSPATKQLILIIAGVTAVIGPLLIVLGQLIIFLAKLPKALIGAKLAIAMLSKSFLALLANPVTWWIVGITVAVVAVIAIFKNWGKIVNWLKGVWQGFTNWLGSAIPKMCQWLDELLEKLSWVAYLIPGLNAIKIGGDVAGLISNNTGKKNNNTTTNNTTTNSHNTTTTNNYTTNNYNAMFPFGSVYSVPST